MGAFTEDIDGLYQTELFEEQYFKFWSVWDDDKDPSKTMAVFQVQAFLEFLEKAKRRVVELGDHCRGFVFEGEYDEQDMFEVVFMTKEGWKLTTEDSQEYTTVIKVSAD